MVVMVASAGESYSAESYTLTNSKYNSVLKRSNQVCRGWAINGVNPNGFNPSIGRNCTKQEVCEEALFGTLNWKNQTFYSQFNNYVSNSMGGAARTEAKRRGYSARHCFKYLVSFFEGKPFKEAPVSLLRLAFNALDKTKRLRLQKKLKSFGYYASSIDGLYGKGTAAALKTYNSKHLGNADLLSSSSNVTALITAVLVTELRDTSPAKPVPTSQSDSTYKVASGTGFYVSNEGHIITNHHVIDGCKDIKAHSKGETLKTVKIAFDRQNDLALLKVSHQPSHVFPISSDGPYPLQDVVVAGFPFGDRVSSSLKFTKGIVSSLSGIGNNYSEIQIDAAIQPGNSGGPIMDEYGNIIAVAVSKLDMKKILKDYGVIPENTNFGIKASAVKNLLEGNAVSFKKPNTEVLPKQELSRVATDGTVFLSCWMTVAQIEDMKNRKVLFTDLE